MKSPKSWHLILAGAACSASLTVLFIFDKPPYLASKVVNGIKNPYKLKSPVYSIGTYATEEGGQQRAKNWKQYCFADIYSVSGIAQEYDLKSYLMQFDEEELRRAYQRNPEVRKINNKRATISTWIYSIDLKDDLFSPLHEAKSDIKKHANLSAQGNYLDFTICRDFLMGVTSTPTGYSLRSEEYFKNPISKKKYNQNLLAAALNDSETLAKVHSGCEHTEVEYYSKKYNIYIYTKTSLSTAYPKGSKKYTRKSSCED